MWLFWLFPGSQFHRTHFSHQTSCNKFEPVAFSLPCSGMLLILFLSLEDVFVLQNRARQLTCSEVLPTPLPPALLRHGIVCDTWFLFYVGQLGSPGSWLHMKITVPVISFLGINFCGKEGTEWAKREVGQWCSPNKSPQSPHCDALGQGWASRFPAC